MAGTSTYRVVKNLCCKIGSIFERLIFMKLGKLEKIRIYQSVKAPDNCGP